MAVHKNMDRNFIFGNFSNGTKTFLGNLVSVFLILSFVFSSILPVPMFALSVSSSIGDEGDLLSVSQDETGDNFVQDVSISLGDENPSGPVVSQTFIDENNNLNTSSSLGDENFEVITVSDIFCQKDSLALI
jgi:hypothetical protein